MEKVELKIENALGEIIIREGEALPMPEPRVLNIAGDIRSVSTFVKNRKADVSKAIAAFQAIDPGAAIVTCDKNKGSIFLQTHPNHAHGSTVTGTLEISEELKKFRINEAKLLTQKEVVDILRFNQVYFADKARAEVVLNAYRAFTYTASASGKSESDNRSNKQNNYSKTVESSLPDDFVLKIPIFKGEDEKAFRVEICYDVTDGGAKFWFESVELHEIIEVEKELIFQRELKHCEGLVIIHK